MVKITPGLHDLLQSMQDTGEGQDIVLHGNAAEQLLGGGD